MLKRELTLFQATAINMIDMVGIGPFVTAALVAATMGSAPLALLAWGLGFVICLVDASVWSELGARMPEAGGSYVFLRESYGRNRWGRLMSFLFVWQTTFQAPLVVASASIGFMKYATYLVGPVDEPVSRLCSAALIVLVTFLLYRRIGDVGKISVALWFCVIATFLWIIGSGLVFGNPSMAFSGALTTPDPNMSIWAALGVASIPTMYSFLGYYNVCHLGAEVRQPERTIPRSMYLSIMGIGILYLLYQISLFSVLPASEVAGSNFVVSLYIDRLYGATAAQVMTGLILVVAVSSLFSLMLGYSRIPFAAARDGIFFRVFERLHPTEHFPHVSLVVLAAIGIVFSLTLTLDDAIKSIITMRVFTQFIAQAVGLVIMRKRDGASSMPWKMWLYPLPALLAVCAWIWVFMSASVQKQQVGIIAPIIGLVAFLLLSKVRGNWPFGTSSTTTSGG
ncbi:MAG: APC family permease [Candidatus Kapabacteria bacterium]|nr:APC family permease [Candidatus Kapabacteria bacterium]